MDYTTQTKQRLIEDVDIRGKKVPIDKCCVPLVKFFNENGLDTKFCCEGHHKYENFEIMFEDYITDEQIFDFLNEYANKYDHSPFIGKFVKWSRRMSGCIASSWLYAVDTVEQADIDYKRLISDEFKIKHKNKF